MVVMPCTLTLGKINVVSAVPMARPELA